MQHSPADNPLVLPAPAAQTPATGYEAWYLVQRALALVCLLISLPLLAMLFVLVKLDSKGPFIYRQSRPGLDGRLFDALKIRTMRPGADRDSSLARSVKASNPQVTRVGRFLREVKLDEIVQLWNIVRGEMAWVGPRPIAPALQQELESEIPGFERRLSVRPGLSSLGQLCVLESAEQDGVITDWKLRFEAECHYLSNRSPAYDLLIFVLTVLYVLRKVLQVGGRRLRRWGSVLMVLLMVGALSACATVHPRGDPDTPAVVTQQLERPVGSVAPSGVAIEPVSLETLERGEPESDYRVGTGDVLSVNIYGEPGMDNLRLPVDGSGYIQVPVVERIKVIDRTAGEIQLELKEKFKERFRDPWVVVMVAEYGSRPLYLLGEFNSPGLVYLDRPTNIIQALGYGKGLNEQAFLRGARLLRSDQIAPVDINGLLKEGRSDQNIWLQPGDTIYVPSIQDQKIIVLGAVNQPGTLLVGNSQMGLAEAISRSEGIRRGSARLDDVRVIRSLSPVSGEFITIDATRIFEGQIPDFQLLAGDVVYVPQNSLADWNDVVEAIKPTFSLFVTSLQPFVQLKVLADNS